MLPRKETPRHVKNVVTMAARYVELNARLHAILQADRLRGGERRIVKHGIRGAIADELESHISKSRMLDRNVQLIASADCNLARSR